MVAISFVALVFYRFLVVLTLELIVQKVWNIPTETPMPLIYIALLVGVLVTIVQEMGGEQ